MFRTKPSSNRSRHVKGLTSSSLVRACMAGLEQRQLLAFDFTFNGNFGPGAFRAPQDFALADVNNDGMADVAYTESQGDFTFRVGVRFGDGRGNFGAATEYDSGGSKGGIRIADVNRDGKVDLIYTGKDDGTLRTRFGNGDGSFGAEAIRVQLAPTISPSSLLTSLELADVDGDGNLDAIGGSVNAGIRVALDDGTGTFNRARLDYDGAGGVNNIVVLDATNDGRPDVIYTTRAGPDLAVLSNMFLGNPAVSSTSFFGGLDPNTYVAAAKVGNQTVWALTEDPDNGAGRVVVGRNPGAAPTDVNFMSNFLDLGAPAIADFDADGLPDLAFPARLNVNDATGTAHLYKGYAQNTPFQGSPTTIASGWTTFGVYAADVNQDGNADMVVGQIGRNSPYDDFNVFISNQHSLVVSTTADENDGNARWNSGTGTSLREAIQYASTYINPPAITFAPFLGNANSTLQLNSEILAGYNSFFGTITIKNTRGTITLSGRGQNRIFNTGLLYRLAVENLTFTGANGGAIFAGLGANLTVTNCTFVGNTAGSSLGSAIYGDAITTVTIRNSTFTNNSGNATITLTNGGVLENNTIANNNSVGINNSNINSTTQSLTLNNNLVSGNSGGDVANSATLTGTHNLIRNGATGGLANTATGDPRLNGLANNGGFTQTMSLQGGSAAYNAGTTLAAITTDQRGVARPQNGAYDIGAYEATLAPAVTSSATIVVNPSSAQVRESEDLSIFVSISDIKDQYGNRIIPTSGSITLNVGGVDIGTQTFSQGQLQLDSFVSQFYYRVLDDNPSGSSFDNVPVIARVTLDAYQANGNGSFQANNASPEAVLVQGPNNVTQGQSFSITGSFLDVGAQDTHTITIDWKDGTPNTVINRTSGPLTFSASHTYAAQAGAPTHYDISVAVADDDGQSGTGQHGINVIRYFESLVVTTTQDEDNGTSDASQGSGTSLREAMKYAAAHAGADTITFSPSLSGQAVVLSHAWSNANSYESTSALNVVGDLTIRGLSGMPGVTLQVAPGTGRRHFLVDSAGTLTLDRLTLTGGSATLSGFNFGGSIWSFGNLTVRNSLFTGNSTNGEGGAIQSWGDSPSLLVENSTFSGNHSDGIAGAIDTGAQSITLRNLTVTNNSATNGHAIVIWKNAATIVNSIIAGNINGSIALTNNGSVSAGSANNLIGDGGTGGLSNGVNGNLTGLSAAALKLGALADNGGATRTHAPLAGSPAINAGIAISGVTTDQRGVARPQYGSADIGAVEYSGAVESLLVTTTADEDNGTSDAGIGTGTSLREALRAAQAPTNITGLGVNGSGWTLNGSTPNIAAGSAGSTDDILTLTPATGGVNSAWFNRKVNVKQFTASFTYTQNAGATGADGITLTFQNAGLNALGAGGGGLGYLGIGSSAALAINIYNNGGVIFPGFATFTGGNGSGGNYTAPLNGVSFTNGQPVNVTLIGNGTNVQVTFAQGANSFTATLGGFDIAQAVGGDTAYVGFTGATGGAIAKQQITHFSFTSAPSPATVTFDPSLAGQTFALTRGWEGATDDTAFRIASDVTIDGGSGVTIQNASTVKRRILLGSEGSRIHLKRLTLSGGDVSGLTDGGAIWNAGTLIVEDSTFTNNKANYGGAIESYTSLTVRNSTFSNNVATGDGGAIHSAVNSQSLLLQNSTFAGNSALVASAIATGAATNTWDHLTIVDNGQASAVIDVYQTTATMRNSLIARNAAEGALTTLGNASGTFTAASTNNLVAGTSWTGLSSATNGINVDPASLRLGTLADNGGPTQTIALLPGSRAINAGGAIGITTDQRGTARPQGSAVDVGAFERTATGASVTGASFEYDHRLAVHFSFNADASVEFGRQSIVLTNLDTNTVMNVGTVLFDATGTTATLLLSNLLANGNYRATLGSATQEFYVLGGDVNRDRTVDFSDLLIIAQNYDRPGTTFSQGDLNYDGVIDFADLLKLAQNYGQSVPATAPRGAVFGTTQIKRTRAASDVVAR